MIRIRRNSFVKRCQLRHERLQLFLQFFLLQKKVIVCIRQSPRDLEPPLSVSFYYRPQTKLRKDNFFTPVCDSVHRGVYNPLGRPPSGRHLPGRHPPGQTPIPQADNPPLRDGHCSGRYASYWNAFLFLF